MDDNRSDVESAAPKVDLRAFRNAAIRGWPEAAFRLYEYHRSRRASAETCLVWATIAAKNGDPRAPHVIGELLMASGRPEDQERARFWLRKSEAGV